MLQNRFNHVLFIRAGCKCFDLVMFNNLVHLNPAPSPQSPSIYDSHAHISTQQQNKLPRSIFHYSLMVYFCVSVLLYSEMCPSARRAGQRHVHSCLLSMCVCVCVRKLTRVFVFTLARG